MHGTGQPVYRVSLLHAGALGAIDNLLLVAADGSEPNLTSQAGLEPGTSPDAEDLPQLSPDAEAVMAAALSDEALESSPDSPDSNRKPTDQSRGSATGKEDSEPPLQALLGTLNPLESQALTQDSLSRPLGDPFTGSSAPPGAEALTQAPPATPQALGAGGASAARASRDSSISAEAQEVIDAGLDKSMSDNPAPSTASGEMFKCTGMLLRQKLLIAPQNIATVQKLSVQERGVGGDRWYYQNSGARKSWLNYDHRWNNEGIAHSYATAYHFAGRFLTSFWPHGIHAVISSNQSC